MLIKGNFMKITWPDLNLPPINLWNAPRTSKWVSAYGCKNLTQRKYSNSNNEKRNPIIANILKFR